MEYSSADFYGRSSAHHSSLSHPFSRRNFLAASGGLLAASVSAPLAASAAPGFSPNEEPLAPEKKRKIPIGVFDAAFPDLTLDQFIDKVAALGLEAVEIGTGGYPGAHHCPVQELLDDPAKLRAWKKKFEDRNIQVATLSCHGNPVYPDAEIAAGYDKSFRNTVLLAEKLEVRVIVGFSGCPGGSPADTVPNWITYRWPPEHGKALDWQWKEKVIPYWKQAAKFAREHGIHRLAFEMHPNFVVYNPRTLLQLREAVGEEIGANCDLSHLFWQGCDAVEVIHFLGKQGAIFHAHMKDTVMYKDNVAKYGVLNFAFDKSDLPNASETFRAVGYGHGANTWKEIVRAYMEIGYEGILSIENEDPILPGEVGVERAAWVLKNVRAELLAS
ncbi:MAG TPA: sugar phosphate isomerase/epimerase [Terriglobales bacterium]|nr:sugar phosphate isomerase/epimerase [Terriglobales bacterium]